MWPRVWRVRDEWEVWVAARVCPPHFLELFCSLSLLFDIFLIVQPRMWVWGEDHKDEAPLSSYHVISDLITVSGCRWRCLVAEEVFFGFFTVTFPLAVADIAPPSHPTPCCSITNINKIPDLQKIPGLSDTDIKWEMSRFRQRKPLRFISPLGSHLGSHARDFRNFVWNPQH